MREFFRRLFGAKGKVPSTPEQAPVVDDLDEALEEEFEMSPEAYARAEARKARTLEVLKAEGVPFIEWLPLTEDNGLRSLEEVVGRFCALMLVTFRGAGGSRDEAQAMRADMGRHLILSANEARFLDNPDPPRKACIQYSWAAHAAAPLAWAMGLLDELHRPDDQTDISALVELTYPDCINRVTQTKALRPLEQILDARDLAYRYHWAVRNASVSGAPAPARLDGGVVMERHRGLNWLTRYCDLDWDDVTTDT